jgi:hypothetical protein
VAAVFGVAAEFAKGSDLLLLALEILGAILVAGLVGILLSRKGRVLYRYARAKVPAVSAGGMMGGAILLLAAGIGIGHVLWQPEATAERPPAAPSNVPSPAHLIDQFPATAPVYGVAFSLATPALAVESRYSVIDLWNSVTGAPIKQLGAELANPVFYRNGSKPVVEVTVPNGMAFSQDGTTFAVGYNVGYDGRISFWDAVTYASRGSVEDAADNDATYTDSACGGAISGVAISPDGNHPVTANDTTGIYVLDLRTGGPTTTVLDGTDGEGAFGVAFRPHSQIFAAADHNGSVLMWNLSGEQPYGEPLADPGSKGAYALAFSADGTQLAVGDLNGNVYVWHMGTSDAPITLSVPDRDHGIGKVG